jgi:pentatricopeptide repeat protein
VSQVPDVFVLTALVSALGRAGEVGKAQYFFNEIQRLGMTPTLHSYNSMIMAFARAGRIDKVRDMLEVMKHKVPHMSLHTRHTRYTTHAFNHMTTQ